MRLGQSLLFRWLLTLGSLLTSHLSIQPSAHGQASLSTTIDVLVDRDFDALVSPRESDGQLFRRLSLDLRLVVPSQLELDEFLADPAPDRWPRWVKRFLNDPLHRERMVDWLDKTLLQRRPNKYVDRAKWLSYLRQVVDENKPLDAIVKESVSSVWWNPSQRAQQRFFLEREGDPHAVSRDIGRVFFGRDMQCAQCHDHPNVDDYLQIDYHGLLAFVSPSLLAEAKFKDEKGAEQKIQIYAERAAGDATFESVFDKGVLFRTGTRVPGGTEQIESYEVPDQRYQAAPMPDSLEGAPKPPSSSRRASLVTQLSNANQAFAENWANRVWAMMLGRGIVHPLDMHHADNPPTNPKLLTALTQSFVSTGYDLRSLIEQIALSEVYQRGSRLPIESSLRNGTVLNLPKDAVDILTNAVNARKQSLESHLPQLALAADSANQGMDDSKTAWRAAQKERVAIRADLDKAEATFNDVKKKLDESNAVLAKANKLRADLNTRVALLEEAASKLEQAKALSPGDDPEIVQAITTAKAKADASKLTLPASEKGVADASALRDTQNVALETERGKIQEVVNRLKPAEQSLTIADQAFVASRVKWQAAQSEHVLAIKNTAALSQLQSWIALSQSVSQVESEHRLAAEARDQQKGTVANYMAQQSKHQPILVEAKANLASIQSKKSVSQEKRASLAAELALLQTTFESLNTSAALVATDSLESAKQAVAASRETRQVTQSALDKELTSIDAELSAQSQKLAALTTEEASMETMRVAAEKSVEQAEQTILVKATAIQQAIDTCGTAFQQVLEDRQKNLAVAPFRSLSPEQLGLSILRATKVLDNYIATEVAELEKQAPLAADATPAQRDARTLQATRQALDKLRPNVDVFANLFASGVGQTSDEFFASPDQALFMANGGSVYQWSAASGSNITDLIAKQPDAMAAVQLMYRSLLSREPTAQELQWVGEQLANAADKKVTIAQELVWGLLTSSEFRVYP